MSMLRIALPVLLTVLAVSSGDAAAQEDGSGAQPVLAAPESPKANPQALIRLGDLYFYGEQVPQDLEKAFGFYRQAAEAGSQTSRLRMGEMLARGVGVEQDIEAGRQIVGEIADAGSVRALVSLGGIYALGDAGPMNPGLAIQTYENAASQGYAQAMLQLGDIYRHGKFGSPQYLKAASYYRNAADMGDAYGLHSLGRLYVEGLARTAGSPAEGMKLLKEAERAGVAEATVSISDSHFYGYGVRRNAKKALAILSEAMKQGNIPATKKFIAAYRDGKRDGRIRLVKKSPRKARELLQKNAYTFSPAEMVYEQFLMESSSARATDYGALFSRLRSFSARDQVRLIRNLRRVNPNLYVFALQSRLAELKAFKGKTTGHLSWSTTLAIHDYCRRTAPPYICRKGPMSDPSAKILSYTFREPLPARVQRTAMIRPPSARPEIRGQGTAKIAPPSARPVR